MLHSNLEFSVDQLTREFSNIPAARKAALQQLASYVQDKIQKGKPINLNFICTHNSRRSHMAQLWALVAAYYYHVPDVLCFSGGTEATAFNPRAVEAMENAGFLITKTRESNNPTYSITYADDVTPITVFSKKYDDPFNHCGNFAAIMTCSHADENCPLVIGAETRLAITYDDPKDFDGTSQEAKKYQERANQIGLEMLYAFSQVTNR